MGFYPDNKATAETPAVPVDTPGIKVDGATVRKPDENLTERKYVVNSVNNQTAVNTERLGTVVADLKGFAEGTPKEVTYYKEHYSETDIKGKRDDPDDTLNNAHKSILKIYGFEIRFTTSLQYEHNTSEQTNKLTGEGYTYPGFQPEQGDQFVLYMGDGRYGLFQIIEMPTRMSIRASTYFKIVFALVSYMSEEEKLEKEEKVVDAAWFDKQRFLNEPGALLYHDEYVEMRFLEKQRSKMIHYYSSRFLDQKVMYSYMRPDGIYDPYVTDFLLKTLDLTEVGSLATQLYCNAPLLDMSVWAALIDRMIPLEGVPITSVIDTYYLGSKCTLANSLINRKYLYWQEGTVSLQDLFDAENEPDPPSGEGIIPPDPSIVIPEESESYDKLLGDTLLHLHPHYLECPLVNGEGSQDGVDSGGFALIFEGSDEHVKLIKGFLKTREIDLSLLHKCIEQVWKLPKLQQFYKMAMYIFLAREALAYVHASAGIYDRN